MFTYPLRALSKDGNTYCVFDISDGPGHWDDEHFILIGRANSPVLRYDTISRGCDIPGVFSGDLIRVGKEDYLVSYQRGLVAKNVQTKQLFYLEDDDFIVISMAEYTGLVVPNRHKKHLYRAEINGNKVDFYIDQLFGKDPKTGAILNNRRGFGYIPVEAIRQYAGIKTADTGLPIFFGDYGLRMESGALVGYVDGKRINVTKGGKL